jgi:molybdate transport system ATP-binding protein
MLSIAVEKTFRDFTLAASFSAPAPGVTVLFGPSGAGKSTILAAIAGLRRPDRVQIDLDGEKLHKIPTARRRIGMVFQDGKLFPHLSVRGNLLYGMARARKPKIFVHEVLDLLDLEPLLRRRPTTLSGGERQRVAIGRALLSQPRLLLMDEPLSSLDSARRGEILPYLLRLKDRVRLPIIYVTHALDEAVYLADHMVLLARGQVLAEGSISEMAARVDLPLAARDDSAGVLQGYLHSHDPERRMTGIACGGLLIQVPLLEAPERTPIRLRIPAREVILSLDTPREISVNNILPATVAAIARDEAAHAALVELDIGGGQLLSRITIDAAERLHLRPGLRLLALVKSMSVETISR